MENDMEFKGMQILNLNCIHMHATHITSCTLPKIMHDKNIHKINRTTAIIATNHIIKFIY